MKKRLYPILLACIFLLASCQRLGTTPPDTDTLPDTDTRPNTDTAPEQSTASTETTDTAEDGAISSPDYEVQVIDGRHYLNFMAGNEIGNAGADGELSFGDGIPYIHFPSLSDMKRAFQSNALSEDQIKTIKTHFQKTDKGFEICDLSNLFAPVMPEELAVEVIYLQDTRYHFSVCKKVPESNFSGTFRFYEESRWEAKCAEEMAIIEKNELVSHTTESLEGVPCEVYVYNTRSAKMKTVILTLSHENDAPPTHVMLIYSLASTVGDSTLPTSDTIPLHVYVYGEQDGLHFHYMLLYPDEAPTVAWLSSFGIAPFTDDTN